MVIPLRDERPSLAELHAEIAAAVEKNRIPAEIIDPQMKRSE